MTTSLGLRLAHLPPTCLVWGLCRPSPPSTGCPLWAWAPSSGQGSGAHQSWGIPLLLLSGALWGHLGSPEAILGGSSSCPSRQGSGAAGLTSGGRQQAHVVLALVTVELPLLEQEVHHLGREGLRLVDHRSAARKDTERTSGSQHRAGGAWARGGGCAGLTWQVRSSSSSRRGRQGLTGDMPLVSCPPHLAGASQLAPWGYSQVPCAVEGQSRGVRREAWPGVSCSPTTSPLPPSPAGVEDAEGRQTRLCLCAAGGAGAP